MKTKIQSLVFNFETELTQLWISWLIGLDGLKPIRTLVIQIDKKRSIEKPNVQTLFIQIDIL